MNVALLQRRMDKFFKTVTPQELIAKFEGMKQKAEESTFTIDDIFVGMELIEIDGKGRATVIEKTANSIKIRQYKTSKNGVDCTSWKALDWFNREYKQI